MNEDQRLEAIQSIRHWESQAGRILRLSITLWGIAISSVSILLSLAVSTNSGDPINVQVPNPDLSVLLMDLVNSTGMGEGTAFIIVISLFLGVLTATTAAFLYIFTYAPFAALIVLDPSREDLVLGSDIEDSYEKKKKQWMRTVRYLKYGFLAVGIGFVLSIPIFVIRNSLFAFIALGLIFAYAGNIVYNNSSTVLSFLDISSYIDLVFLPLTLPLTWTLIRYDPEVQGPINFAGVVVGTIIMLVALFRDRNRGSSRLKQQIFRDYILAPIFILLSFLLFIILSDYISVGLTDYVTSFIISLAFTAFISGTVAIGVLNAMTVSEKLQKSDGLLKGLLQRVREGE